MLSLSQRQSLQQRLSPQQVQYLKMLQLPVVALEQRIKQEIEVNPMLEELADTAQETEFDQDQEQEQEQVPAIVERKGETKDEVPTSDAPGEEKSESNDNDWDDFFTDQYDDYRTSAFNDPNDEEQEELPQRSDVTLAEQLLEQLRMQQITEDELALAEEIIGNIDEHGYLRRDLREIVEDLNKFMGATRAATVGHSGKQLGDGHFGAYEEFVGDTPFGRERLAAHPLGDANGHNRPGVDVGAHDTFEPIEDALTDAFDDEDLRSPTPAGGASSRRHTVLEGSQSDDVDTIARTAHASAGTLSIEEMSTLSIEDLARMLEQGTSARQAQAVSMRAESAAVQRSLNTFGEIIEAASGPVEEIFSVAEAERVLHRIQRLDPPGIGARDLQECLAVQLEILRGHSPEHDLAYRIITEAYAEFAMKHFEKIGDRLKCSIDDLKSAIDVVKTLNPKPGEGSVSIINDNYLTPDFVIERDAEDFVIIPNDRHVPTLRINRAYQELMRRGKAKKSGIDRDTRKFLREKFEAAKWFIASIQQRRQTMMRVMRAIIDLQHEFFIGGQDYIRPMIYKDVAERIGMDISTVCRVVNGKYVQTDYGTFELRYFFSEKLETTSGEEVSTKIVKSRLQELIEAEDKHKPLSDDALSKMMKKAGYYVARRTVAKYREQLNIPVARLRRAL